MKLIYLLASTLLFACCAGRQETPIEVQSATYEVIDYDPPKHVAVDLKRLSDGRTFHVSFGKHCSNYSEYLYIGRQVKLNRYVYTDGERDVIEFNDEELRDCFCD
jgi:hypothetical protein